MPLYSAISSFDNSYSQVSHTKKDFKEILPKIWAVITKPYSYTKNNIFKLKSL